MTESQRAGLCAYSIHNIFSSEGAIYAIEQHFLLAVDEYDAERRARILAADSVHSDPRIPHFGIEVMVEIHEPDPDPDDDGPALPPAPRVRPHCPDCGSDDILHEALAHWNDQLQGWALADRYADQICNVCGREGHDFARWLPLGSPAVTLGARLPIIGHVDIVEWRQGVVLRIVDGVMDVRFDPIPGEYGHRIEQIKFG